MLQFDKKYALLQNNTTTQHAIDQFTSKNVSGQHKISKVFSSKCLW